VNHRVVLVGFEKEMGFVTKALNIMTYVELR